MSRHHHGDGRPQTRIEDVAGSQLTKRVVHLLKSGGVRDIRIAVPGGQLLLDGSIDVSVGRDGAAGLPEPWSAIIATLVDHVERVRIEVVHAGDGHGNGKAAGLRGNGTAPGD